MATKGLAEILKEAGELSGINDKIAHLQKHSSASLKDVVGFCYDPRVKWALPEGEPPYTPTEKEEDLQGVLYSEIKKIYIFLDCPRAEGISMMKREQQFIQLLESVDPDDAKLLIGMKDRRLPYKGITYKLIKKAFPSITTEWPDEEPDFSQ